MFERRLRLFLLFIFLGAFLLAARAAQVQVVQRSEWALKASSDAERPTFIPARRGDLLDFNGEVIATDVPAFEASVNFRVIGQEPDAGWLKEEAVHRAKKLKSYAGASEDDRALLINEQAQGVRNDLHQMWTLLARVSGERIDEIDELRTDIEDEVRDKQEHFVTKQYQAAQRAYDEAPSAPWYVRILSGTPRAPDLESLSNKLVVSEQLGFHTIIGDLTAEQYNELALAQDRLPQYKPDGGQWTSVLKLGPAVKRRYPFGEVACHVIGHVGAVSREDRAADVNKGDKRRSYSFDDRIGREGLERMAEQQLRGTLGTKVADRQTGEAKPGADVTTTIDIQLQSMIQNAFKTVEFQTPDIDPTDPKGHRKIVDTIPMNGAAVVIDVKTGQVRALVSVPTFDLNRFDEDYSTLVEDDLNRPMTNRALLDKSEPGSTVKPIVGLGAVTSHLAKATDRVECTGYPIIDGKRLSKPRCWTMSMFGTQNVGDHHRVPSGYPHPDGFLNLTDAIERSCNVYFETQGNKLGIIGLSNWMRRFGLGRKTGIGLPEARGLVPDQATIPSTDRASAPLYSSIGQSWVLATPIQVANEMATIARDGVWMKPTLLVDPPPATQPVDENDADYIPDRVDLHLDPDALAAVKLGMFEVVNDPAGTGTRVASDRVKVAAKTGSATAAQLIRYHRDENGRVVIVEGRPQYEFVPYGSHAQPNAELPWYRTSGIDDATNRPKGTHSWVAGFAPADHPQIAFAAYVEYGGSGGFAAASVVRQMIDACIAQGYLTADIAVTTPTPSIPAHLARPDDVPTDTEH